MTEPTTHILESTEASVSSGTIDPRRPPALTIESGDIVSCPNTWTQWANRARFGMSFADREPLRKQFPAGPYSNLGPVVVNGAEPGDVVECRMIRTWPIDWGWNSFPLGVGALPSDFDEPYVHYFRFNEERTSAEFVDGIQIPLRPSMGVYAVEPEGDEPISAIAGRRRTASESRTGSPPSTRTPSTTSASTSRSRLLPETPTMSSGVGA